MNNPNNKKINPHNKPRRYHSNNHQNDLIPQEKKEVFAHCKICGTGISNEVYSLKLEDFYIHFECAIKKTKEIALEENPQQSKRYKVSYVGSNTFAVYLEKGEPYQWEIIKKINLQELLPLISAQKEE